ncbi:hypothetical protein C7459_12465 [Tumebacillus permanentifrigoris]|uniref:Uncharacterized protein n=2 Tax=Tumebacillus permanentifrigoris TaxID=378543 RepID=A0A316DQ74_9BACL|nr:hypothetical protein C7459_12465 [Tumebacillus permanentifrigoris]
MQVTVNVDLKNVGLFQELVGLLGRAIQTHPERDSLILEYNALVHDKNPYLITAPDSEGARRIAASKGLTPNDWVYVPLDERTRSLVLEDRTGYRREKLIGSFTEEEIEMLTGYAAKA